jgi:hypothetical protein
MILRLARVRVNVLGCHYMDSVAAVAGIYNALYERAGSFGTKTSAANAVGNFLSHY